MYTLKTEHSFDAAHFLYGYEGKCSNIHGHRWRVVAEVSSDELETTGQNRGMYVDFGDLKKDLKEIGFFKSVKDSPLNKQEQIEVKKYIIDTKDFDIRLISLIAEDEREDILYALLTKAMDDGLDASTTKIFLANKDYLQLIQPELREVIEKRVEGTSIFATYLELKENDNQKCIADFQKISFDWKRREAYEKSED